MIAVPTLEIGAADEGAVDLARTLTGAGHRALVVSHGGRLEGVPSTLVNVRGPEPEVEREGAISRTDVECALAELP